MPTGNFFSIKMRNNLIYNTYLHRNLQLNRLSLVRTSTPWNIYSTAHIDMKPFQPKKVGRELSRLVY